MGNCLVFSRKREQKLEFFVSARFDMIDIYVRPKHDLPQNCRYEIFYRNKVNAVNWIKCTDDNVKALSEEVPGRFCTISNLEPTTEYEVRGVVAYQNDGSKIIAESLIKTAKTKQAMVVTKSYIAIAKVDRGVVDKKVSALVGDILLEENANNQPDVTDSFETGIYSNEVTGFVYLKNTRTNQVGLIPVDAVSRNPVGDNPASVMDQDFFFKVNRRKAAIWMMRPSVEAGRFLIRPSHCRNFMALSVRFGVTTDGMPQVEHFKLFILPDGFGCYLNIPLRTFEDIRQLIAYYKVHSLSTTRRVVLTDPFPRNPRPPTNLDEISFPSSKLVILEQLGQGNFGEVRKAQLHNLDVAVKQIILPRRDNERSLGLQNREALLREAQEMAPYFHDNLVRLIGICVDSEPYLIVTEFMNHGSLFKWLNDDTAVADIQLQTVVDILSQVACGMAYLEEKNVVHRDLRAANVLVHEENAQFEVKITDFGLTRTIREQAETYTPSPERVILPVRWSPPEAIQNRQFSTKSDVWSFGVLFYEVVTLGTQPFSDKTVTEARAYIVSGGRITLQDCRANKRQIQVPRALPAEELCPDSLFNKFAQCWHDDPQERPTFAALWDILENYDTRSDYI